MQGLRSGHEARLGRKGAHRGKELNLIKMVLVGGAAAGRAQVSLSPVPSRVKIKN